MDRWLGNHLVIGLGRADSGGRDRHARRRRSTAGGAALLYDVDAARNQTTVTLEVAFSGFAGDFGVLLPLPAAPLAVSVDEAKETWGVYPWHQQIAGVFDWAFEQPSLTLLEPPAVCRALVTMDATCPHPYAAVGSYLDDAPRILTTVEEVQGWLQEHDYRLAPDLLAAYAGSTFVALGAQALGGSWGWLPLLSATYPGTEPVLPLRLLANKATTLYMEVGILADQPYTIPNYARRQPDPTALRHISPLRFDEYFTEEYCRRGSLRFYPPLGAYLTDLLAGEQAYVLEYAGPAAILLDADLGDEQRAKVEGFLGASRHFTLFYLEPDAQNLMEDPRLTPASAGPEVSNILDATETNAFTYWGCTVSPSLEPDPRLPERTYVPTLDKEVAHPAGWKLSRIAGLSNAGAYCEAAAPEVWLDVLAPQPVTLPDLQAALRGEAAPPMLIIAPVQSRLTLEDMVGVTLETPSNWIALWHYRVDHSAWRYSPFTYAYDVCRIPDAAQLRWVVSDWESSQTLYEAMLDDALSYSYFLAPDLPQTAFMTGKFASYAPESGRSIAVGYPAGWQIHTTPDMAHHYWITPEGDPEGPRLTILGWEVLLGVEPANTGVWLPDDQFPAWLEAIRARYGLPTTFDLLAIRSRCGDLELTEGDRVVSFAQGGRHGIFILHETDLIEISLPVDASEAEWDTLRHMLDSLDYRGMCG